MKNMQSKTQQSRTPTLDSYRTVFKHMPDRPDVYRVISRRKKLICINLSARKDAKIDMLLP